MVDGIVGIYSISTLIVCSMESGTFFARLLDQAASFVLRRFRPTSQSIMVLRDGQWEIVMVPNPTTTTDLDDQFGEGCWAFPSCE